VRPDNESEAFTGSWEASGEEPRLPGASWGFFLSETYRLGGGSLLRVLDRAHPLVDPTPAAVSFLER
jgi:hypothetical protein